MCVCVCVCVCGHISWGTVLGEIEKESLNFRLKFLEMTHTHTHTHTYIYIYRERERVCVCVCVCVRERERERQRDRDRNRSDVLLQNHMKIMFVESPREFILFYFVLLLKYRNIARHRGLYFTDLDSFYR